MTNTLRTAPLYLVSIAIIVWAALGCTALAAAIVFPVAFVPAIAIVVAFETIGEVRIERALARLARRDEVVAA